MGSRDDGIVLIDKDEGESSFTVVKKVRRILKIKKTGHAGTLDPFATGLLVVLLGQGTKLAPYLMAGEKEYSATVRLGVETDTMDPTGRIVGVRPVPALDPDSIRETARDFTGPIEQVPPIFSALKYQGRRAYELARQGIKVELKKRKATIHRLEIVSVDLPDVSMIVACSRGTYIRSLASEFGKALGTGAHLRCLRRLSSGSFTVKEALSLREMGSPDPAEVLRKKVVPLRNALPQVLEVEVNPLMARKIRNGYQPSWKDLQPVSDLPDLFEGDLKAVTGPDLVALLRVGWDSRTAHGWAKVRRVFQ